MHLVEHKRGNAIYVAELSRDKELSPGVREGMVTALQKKMKEDNTHALGEPNETVEWHPGQGEYFHYWHQEVCKECIK